MSWMYEAEVNFFLGKIVCYFWKVYFFVKMAVKFRNLQISIILNTDTNRIFPISFKFRHISLRYTLLEKQFSSKQILLLVWGEQVFFLSEFSFTDTDDSQGSRGRDQNILTLSTTSTRTRTSHISLQFGSISK